MTTLSTLHRHRLYLDCRRCGHNGSVMLRPHAEARPSMPVAQFVELCRCAACGTLGGHEFRIVWAHEDQG